MKFQRVHKSTLQSQQKPQEISKLTPRYFGIQSKETSEKPLTQEQIDNQAFQIQKMDATKLEIQAKYGTITPEGQERLGVLQAKMNNFWMQRKESSKGQPNLLEIPDLFTRRETRLAQQIQPQLTIGQPDDKYEQEANRVATHVVSQMHQPQSKDIPIQTASKLKHQVGVSDKRTASSASGNVVNTVDGIQCKVTQTDGDVIQLVGVQDMIKKFEQIAQENKVSTDSQPWLSDNRKPTTDRITNKPIKAEEEAQQLESESGSSIYTDSQASDFRPQQSKEEVKSEDEIPSTSSESETTLFDINREVEKNLNKIADYLFSKNKIEDFILSQYKGGSDRFILKQKFKVFYDDIMQSSRKSLTDLLSSKIQNGLTEITPLSDEEIIKFVEEIELIVKEIKLKNEAEQLRKDNEDLIKNIKFKTTFITSNYKTVTKSPSSSDSKKQLSLKEHLKETQDILEGGDITEAREKLPDLLLNPGKVVSLLSDDEVRGLLQKFLSRHDPDKLKKPTNIEIPKSKVEEQTKPEIPKSKVEEQTKPKTTGKERWNKLKKIVRTDSSLPQIKGKSKSLSYYDRDKANENYWLEAWDALHRPAFKLGDEHFGKWLYETGIKKWLDEQEAKDKEMRTAFEEQKQLEDGETNFWEWKAKSKYAGKSSPPPTTESFWDYLARKNINIPGVKYLESEAERRPRGVTISGGTWTDAFGDDLSSERMIAHGAPDNGKDWMIFVLSPDGKFYADGHKEGEYHHSSALAGIPVKGAGAIKVINGTLEAIADKSGHYKPNMHQMYTTLRHLEKLGVNPETYMVYTRDLGDMEGNKWIEKYENSGEFKEYREQQQKNLNTIEQRRKREKASREPK
ncbi:MAG: hypothetical protein HWQ35_04490 [Nostoc sp. NMS1]|uniref:hypothetical protein n=1 Tax=unclassified Nostoc TaxID=2593658 RepID=UPI0025EA9568|nr:MULTISPECIES: hypothetical protein [unclassified Nostoc]MBN3905855.1 hypothetical protein [Nostoc sp. NMS1]MBN3991403.1 hypothetical protein [Nostoc sp. NMS2]